MFLMYIWVDIWFLGQSMKPGTIENAVGYYRLVCDLLQVEYERKVKGFGTGWEPMTRFTVFTVWKVVVYCRRTQTVNGK